MDIFLNGGPQIGLIGERMNKSLLLVVLCAILFSGCFCRDRYFETDFYPVVDNWGVKAHIRDSERCSGSDYVVCRAIVQIEQKFIDEDTLKNMAVRVDSAELVVGNTFYKQINKNKSFDRGRKIGGRLKSTPPLNFVNVLYFNDSYDANDSVWFPLIERDVKEVYVTAYVSFMFPEDGHVESRKIQMKLHEVVESSLYLWRFFDY